MNKSNEFEIDDNFDMEKFHNEKLAELSKDFIEKTSSYLKEQIPLEIKNQILDIYKKEGNDWIISRHLSFGMQIRNVLRDGGFLDDQLPSGNWDDYYVSILEIAVGLRIYG